MYLRRGFSFHGMRMLTDSVETVGGAHNPQQRLQQKLQQQQPQQKQQHPQPNPQQVKQQNSPNTSFLHVDILLNVPGYSNRRKIILYDSSKCFYPRIDPSSPQLHKKQE